MNKLTWFIAGIAVGFAGAHFAHRTSAGRRVFDSIDRGAREFGDAVAKGYRTREAEFLDASAENPGVGTAESQKEF